jgi:hypothetical protein
VATVLGLIGLAIFIVCVIALAAGVTWTVVRLTPSPEEREAKRAAAAQAAAAATPSDT